MPHSERGGEEGGGIEREREREREREMLRVPWRIDRHDTVANWTNLKLLLDMLKTPPERILECLLW